MAIGAARVMAAGKAGLESLPYFVDELMAQGIPQLAPLGLDHGEVTGGKTDLNRFDEETRVRREGSWGDIFELGASSPGIAMSVTGTDVKVMLEKINPRASRQVIHLADSPAQIGIWCRLNIEAHCHTTYQMWERYKARWGYGIEHYLAVVIPYCPEGPTSGTVGMYLGAALRKYFDDKNRSNELIVWGIELCPSMSRDDEDNDSQHRFRGYVAREELLAGVPLSNDANDDTRYDPFDINIVFDGGGEPGVSTDSLDYVHSALDLAAAQTTACLLNGAAGKSNAEAEVRLLEGKRWNAYLTHVVSERSYGTASRYMNYRAALPWNRDPDAWESASIGRRREVFLERVGEEIQRRLDCEPNSEVTERVGRLIGFADAIRDIPVEAKWNNFLTKNRENSLKRIGDLLDAAVTEDERNYEQVTHTDRPPSTITPSRSPFCVNLSFPAEQRHREAMQSLTAGIPVPLLEILGDPGSTALRGNLAGRYKDSLTRYDCNPSESNSSAFFDEIISISIGDWRRDEKTLRIDWEGLDFYLAADRRHIPDTLVGIPFDLSDVMTSRDSGGSNQSKKPVALKWKLPDVPHYVPSEYSHLILARVRRGDGFTDICDYRDLKQNFEDIISRLDRWREHARYYGTKPPLELRLDVGAAHTNVDTTDGSSLSASSSANGQPDHTELTTDLA